MSTSPSLGEPTTVKKSIPQPDQFDKIQQSSWCKVKTYKMYREVLHNHSLLSQQSSDIAISQQPPQEQSFQRSDKQIQNVPLYNDLPLKLLRDPQDQIQNQPDREERIYEDTNQFFIFDSIVFDRQMMDMLIEQERRNKFLRAQIEGLDKYHRLYQEQYTIMKNKKLGKVNSVNISQQIFKNINLETEKLSKHIKPQAWFKNYKQLIAYRQSSLKLAQQNLPQEIRNLQDRIKILRSKKDDILELQNKLRQDRQKIQIQLQKERLERKKNLIAIYIEKQEKQIKNLQLTVEKMEQILRFG